MLEHLLEACGTGEYVTVGGVVLSGGGKFLELVDTEKCKAL